MDTIKPKSIIMIYVVLLMIIIGCTKEDSNPFDGYFQGSFYYQNQSYFEAIIFSGESFEEVPSGGALYQKFPCIVDGTYKINKDKIVFYSSSLPSEEANCSHSYLLSGEYHLTTKSPSEISFYKGEGDELQTYTLKLITANR